MTKVPHVHVAQLHECFMLLCAVARPGTCIAHARPTSRLSACTYPYSLLPARHLSSAAHRAATIRAPHASTTSPLADSHLASAALAAMQQLRSGCNASSAPGARPDATCRLPSVPLSCPSSSSCGPGLGAGTSCRAQGSAGAAAGLSNQVRGVQCPPCRWQLDGCSAC